MATENFNLSKKIMYNLDILDCFGEVCKINAINEIDIKEFIRLLKDKMGNTTRGLNNKDLQIFYKEIDKLTGDKLK